MSRRDVDLDRRTFLALIGAGAGVSALGVGCVSLDVGARNSWVDASGRALWTPPAMPIPTWGDGGDAASDAARFASYEVQDALVVPEGFRYERVATWGEHFGDVRFGTSCDYTALVPIEGRPDEYFLVVNHEAVEARPWLQGYSSAHGAKLPELRIRPHPQRPDELCTIELDGNTLTVLDKGFGTWRGDVLSDRRLEPIARAALDDLGVSVLHVRQDREGCVRVLRASKRHARISGLHPTTPTLGNCSGGVTPWGTVLTAEENYQDYVPEAVDARGDLGIGRYSIGMSQEGGGTELPAYFRGLGAACDPPCDGRDFGWIGEVDPARGTLRKLHRLGRFRHENAAVCCRAGAALVVYQGDDRRGGHLWRYESAALVHDPRDAGNSALFDQGTLSVARFAADGTGIWVPLAPSTRLARPRPSACAGGTLWVPERRSVEVGQAPTGTRQRVVGELDASSGVPVGDWIASVEAACGKPFAELTLGDLVWPPADAPELAGAALEAHRRRVIELEAFAMANAIAATPLGRPE
ncbi:MAG TPA: alkaline phosphatase PhoX, partial [Planctomycetota bacterium]|nr:alkaline phosphatase PhoX [Planctomycetota bacterium]